MGGWPEHPQAPGADPDAQWPDHPQAPAAGQFQPGQDQILPNAPYGPTDMLAHGVSFGASDPIRAALHAGVDWGATKLGLNEPGTSTPTDRGFDFQRRWEEVARGRRQYESEHPVQAFAANTAGGLAYAPARVGLSAAEAAMPWMANLPGWLRARLGTLATNPAAPEMTTEAAPSLGRQVATSTAIGAGGGAITGASDNPEQPGWGAATNALTGGALSAVMPVAQRVGSAAWQAGRNLLNPAGTAQRNAEDILNQHIGTDLRVGSPELGSNPPPGQPLTGAAERISNSTAPLSVADLYPSVKRYVGGLYDSWAPTATSIFNNLRNRDLGAGDRIGSQLDRLSVTGPSSFAAEQTLRANRQAAADTAYDAFRAHPPLNPDVSRPGGELATILNTPSGREGVRMAQEIAGNRRIDLASEGITFDADGNVQFTRVPSWQALDYVKQGIDATIADRFPRDAITGRRDLGSRGAAMVDARSDLVRIMDGENPAYAGARQAYEEHSSAMDAIRRGGESLFDDKVTPEMQRHQFSLLSPQDQDLYRLGATNAARERLATTKQSQDEAKRIADSPASQEKLRVLFPDDASHQAFLRHLEDERTIFQTGLDITGNSATARRLGGMSVAAPQTSASMAIPAAMTTLVTTGGNVPAAAMTGAGVAAGHAASGRWNTARQLMAGNSPEAQHTAANMALAPGPAALGVMGLLQQPNERLVAPRWLPGAVLGTQAPDDLALLQEGIRGLLAPNDRRR